MSGPKNNLPDDIEGLTFREIEAKYGEEVAINAGIASDPDTWELTPEEAARARPASEVVPHIVAAYRRRKAREREAERKPPASLRRAQSPPA